MIYANKKIIIEKYESTFFFNPHQKIDLKYMIFWKITLKPKI